MADMTAGQKAAHTRKWRQAAAKAHARARNAKTFARYALSKTGWKVLTLDTRRGYEYKGVVDLVAVRRNNRRPDELTVMLVQVKGGSARVKREEQSRLEKAVNQVRLVWNVAEKPARTVRFAKSISSSHWAGATPRGHRPLRARAAIMKTSERTDFQTKAAPGCRHGAGSRIGKETGA
ncbi:MAG: hypothetical protein U0587_18775 [Candidatus Binatia bacterium]